MVCFFLLKVFYLIIYEYICFSNSKNMTIIYLHGFNGNVDPKIYSVLEKHGDNVIYEKINYAGTRNLADLYSRYLKEGILVIGNSLGAYIGFQVSNYGNVPALLFNPSFNFKSGGELRYMENSHQCFQKKIILSINDEILDQKKNVKYLKELGYDNQISMVSMGHLIPIDFFESCFDQFYKEYKIIVKEEKKSRDKKGYYEKDIKKSVLNDDWTIPASTQSTYAPIDTTFYTSSTSTNTNGVVITAQQNNNTQW